MQQVIQYLLHTPLITRMKNKGEILHADRQADPSAAPPGNMIKERCISINTAAFQRPLPRRFLAQRLYYI